MLIVLVFVYKIHEPNCSWNIFKTFKLTPRLLKYQLYKNVACLQIIIMNPLNAKKVIIKRLCWTVFFFVE